MTRAVDPQQLMSLTADECRAPTRRLTRLVVLLALLGAARLAWVGDVPFLNDEPQLIAAALDANEAGQLVQRGLTGTRGVHYGPLPIWIYQLLLALTHDPITVVFLKTLLVTLVTALAIIGFAASCPFLLPWFGAVAFLSPYLWLYSRDLWDNSFAIPISALVWSAYVSFCREQRVWKLGLVLGAMTLGFLTHLMTLPLILAVGLHLFVWHRRWVDDHKRIVPVLSAIFYLVCVPYLLSLVTSRQHPADPGLLNTRPADYAAPDSFAAPWLGGGQFSGLGMEYYLGSGWDAGLPVLRALRSLTGMGCVFGWLGLAAAAWMIWRERRFATPATLELQVCALAALTIVIHASLWFAMSLPDLLHYFNGVWMAWLFCVWYAAGLLWRHRAARFVVALYALSSLAFLASVVSMLHANGGNREAHYGPTLRNQIQIAQELNAYSPSSPIVFECVQPRQLVASLALLQRLLARGETAELPLRTLAIGCEHPDRPDDGRLHLDVRP